jgi:hypothetical protein
MGLFGFASGHYGAPRVPILIKTSASSAIFERQVSRTPVDYQAISLQPAANIVLDQRPWKQPIDFSRPGKPTDNAFIESFNGKLRAECLNAHWFMSLDDARRKCEAWRRDYNEERTSQRDRQQSPDRADRSVSGMRPALTGTGWKRDQRAGPRMGSSSSALGVCASPTSPSGSSAALTVKSYCLRLNLNPGQIYPCR